MMSAFLSRGKINGFPKAPARGIVGARRVPQLLSGGADAGFGPSAGLRMPGSNRGRVRATVRVLRLAEDAVGVRTVAKKRRYVQGTIRREQRFKYKN